jgi:allophanate hydrolase subunit 2
VVAVVAGADLPLAAQARPGTRLRFRFVPVAAAREAAGGA